MFARTVLLILFAFITGCGSGDDAAPPPGGDNPPPVVPPPAATAPSISTQPASVSVTAGQAATFSVAATGTGPFTYQWRRNGVDLPGATSATYTTSATDMNDSGGAYTAVVSNSAGSVTSAAAVLTVTLPAGTTSSVAVEQTTAFLTGVGQTALLEARPVDAQGAPIAGIVTWQSSNPTAVTVEGTGRITAHSIGSAMLFAEANGIRSQPIFVVVAEPMPGALVLDDQQVIAVGAPLNLAADQVPGVGTRYEVTTSGIVNVPAPGTVVLAAADAPVAGKVVSTRAEAGNLIITLELAALPDLLARYDIDWDIDLSTIPVEAININSTVDMLSTHRQAQEFQKAQAQARPEDERFRNFNCEGEFSASLVSANISLTPQLGAHLIIQSSRDDHTLPPDFAKLALVGSQSLKGTASIKLSAEFGTKVECVAQAQVEIPVGGFISVLVMPALRLGVGFELEGKLVAVTAELTATGTIGATETLGFECSSAIAAGCIALSDVSMIDDFKLTKKVPSVNDMHMELSGQIFAVAGIDAVFGLGLFNAEIVEAKVGPKQEFDLAFPDDQAKNSSMASNYKLDLAGIIQPGAALSEAIKKLIGDDNVTLNFKVPFSTPLAASPKGTLDLSSGDVGYGTPVAFQVHLDQPLTYPLLGENGETEYNADSVKLYRRKEGEADFTEWKSLPAANGQTTFQTEWTPTSSDMGNYEFAAFVETRMPVPLLEIAEDSVKQLHVRGPGWYGNVTFTLQGSETTTLTSSEGNGTSTTVTTYTDSASGTYQLETIPGAEGAPLLRVAQASGTMSKGLVEQYDNQHTFGGCNITVSQTRERFEQGVLEKLEGSIVLISLPGDGSYQITLPNMAGDSQGTVRVEASETSSGAQHCDPAEPTSHTSEFEGNLSTTILTVNGQIGENPTVLTGTANVTIEGLPDHQYSVSWTLQQ